MIEGSNYDSVDLDEVSLEELRYSYPDMPVFLFKS